MSKKLFIATAQILKTTIPNDETRGRVAAAFADLFESENERFDRNKFLLACGVEADDE